MKILICEDEALAGSHLARIVRGIRPDAEILAVLETGKQVAAWLSQVTPDLVFMDIELADGPCFASLDGVEIGCPVVFATAYDHYAVQAFRLNGIDYLIKPITEEQVAAAFEKLERMRGMLALAGPTVMRREMFEGRVYKERFLVKTGHKLLPVKVEDIAWFKAVDRLVWLYTAEGKKYIVNYTLGDLEGLLDPQRFIRLNRQYLASHGAIAELHPYFKGQVMVRLRPKTDDEIVVSRGQTPVLKAWLER